MFEQRFGRSLLQVDKQSFELHNLLNVSKTASDEISTQSPCSVNSLNANFQMFFEACDIYNPVPAVLK